MHANKTGAPEMRIADRELPRVVLILSINIIDAG